MELKNSYHAVVKNVWKVERNLGFILEKKNWDTHPINILSLTCDLDIGGVHIKDTSISVKKFKELCVLSSDGYHSFELTSDEVNINV